MEEKSIFASHFTDERSICKALVGLTNAPERQRRVIRERSAQLRAELWHLVMYYRTTDSADEYDAPVCNVALQLLLQCASESSSADKNEADEVQLVLLRLVQTLAAPWPLPDYDTMARVLVELLFQAQLPSPEVLQLIADIAAGPAAQRQPEWEAAVQEALVAAASRTPAFVAASQRWRDRGLHVVSKQTLPVLVELAPVGTSFEQELVLVSLLVQSRQTREDLVLQHGGAHFLAAIVRGDGTAAARAFALVIVKTLVAKSTVCRNEMLQFWLHEQSAAGDSRLESDSNPFVDALRRYNERFIGAATLSALRDGTVTDSDELTTLMGQMALIEYLCKYRSLLEVLTERLTSTMFDTDVSTSKADLWMTLLVGLDSLKRQDCVSYPYVVVDTQLATAIALLALEVEDETPFWEVAVRTLRSCVRITEATCDAIATRGSIPQLVSLLASQSRHSALGMELIGLLRDLTGASNLSFAAETNQVVLSLCYARYHDGALSHASLSPVYFQNLLLLYCDIPEMKLGASDGIDQAIAIGAAAELLSARTSETIRALALHFLHDELRLHESDPVQFRAKSYATAIVSDKLVGLIGLTMDGPDETRQLARRILTALAVCDAGVGAKVRQYQYLEPPAVLPALLDVWQREQVEALRDDEQMYEYDESDSEEERLEDAVEDAAVGVAAVMIDDVSDDSTRASAKQAPQWAEKAKWENEDEWELL